MSEGAKPAAGRLPMVAVGMGDPAGVGPEVVVKALADPDVYTECIPLVIGDAETLRRAAGWSGSSVRLVTIGDPAEANPEPGVLQVIDLANLPSALPMGQPSSEGGRASIEYLDRGVELNLAGKTEAIVSAPFNKESIKKAGHHFLDEYEYLRDVCGAKDYSVFSIGPSFTLASVTLHVAMADMPAMITKERVLTTIRYSDAAARAKGIERPRIGLAALNPHGGEGGTMGREEVEAIKPAIEAARAEGIDAHGPFPADSFFMTVKKPAYDVYVGMYHDQGRIALKLLDFGRAVSMAEGLPILFATVGHGTAFDIAGKGIARHENMKEAILVASRRAVSRRSDRK